ncbi:MAG TPA: hypothetical protein VJL34_04790 [Anaerolineales bacterium]|nr:hypothetical protein [Anaerolineales bacterium]
MKNLDGRALWLRWVEANAFGEVFGLGATLAVGGYAISRLEMQSEIGFVLVSFLIAVLSGVIEATVVGLAQWWAMHPWLRTLTRRAWWLATLAGALLAYILGYLPSTIMNLGEQASQTTVSEPPQWIVLLLAGGLGMVGGAVLSFAQLLVLRKHLERAGWWMPANMLAWLGGMPVIFWGIDAAQKGQPLLQAALIMGGTLLLAGFVVGAIHGAFLVWMVGQERRQAGEHEKSS